MKQRALNLMRATGAFAPFRLANRSKALIVMYHRFSASEDGTATSARAFAAQLDYLTAHYRILPLSTLAERLANGHSLPAGVAAITIDDGYSDAYEVAFPILQQYNIPAALFVVTDFIDHKTWLWTDKLRYVTARAKEGSLETNINGSRMSVELNGGASRIEAAARINSILKSISDHDKDEAINEIASSLNIQLPNIPPPQFSPLTWQQAREMDAARIEIGSHTLTHPILTNISAERLRLELAESKSRLESAMGRSVELFCYPNGDSDALVRREVERAGYKCAVTTECGLNSEHSDPLALKRIPTERDMAHFVQSTSGFEQIKDRLMRRQPQIFSSVKQ